MGNVINNFLLLSTSIRASIVVFLIIVVFWWILGRKVLWILSFLPYITRKIFLLLYYFVELIISIIHEKIGGIFYKIDNKKSELGEKINTLLTNWYNLWHSSKKSNIGISMLIYILIVCYITIPTFLGIEGTALFNGQKMYISSEATFVKWIEKHGWYNSKSIPSIHKVNSREQEAFNLELIVSLDDSSLSIRSAPSIKNSTILERVYKGDTIIWNGELSFGMTDYGNIEPWVKVITRNGTEGWTRLYYLYPEKYDYLKLKVLLE